MIRQFSMLLVAVTAVAFCSQSYAAGVQYTTIQDPNYDASNPNNPANENTDDVSDYLEFTGGYGLKIRSTKTGRTREFVMGSDDIVAKIVRACGRETKRMVIAWVWGTDKAGNRVRIIRGVIF